MMLALACVTCQDGDVIFSFPAGDAALDFAGTRQLRNNPEPREQLADPSDLDAWFRQAGLVDDTSFTAADFDRALSVREAIYDLVAARVNGSEADPTAVATLNAAASAPSIAPQLVGTSMRREATPAQALSSVARGAIKILGGPSAQLLRQCNNEGCTQVYVDHSRGARREWCSMDPCGNKIKAAAYRARKRAVAA